MCAELEQAQVELRHMRDAIGTLRARLTVTTDMLEQLYIEGKPSFGRKTDDQDALVGWHDDHMAAIKFARKALQETVEWRG